MLEINEFLEYADKVCGECLFRKEENCKNCFLHKMYDIYNGEITKDLIIDGINRNLVRFGWPDNGEDTVVCFIGDNWFYFGGHTAEGITPSEYLAVTDILDNINSILTVLNDFKKLAPDEYLYYYWYLKENME